MNETYLLTGGNMGDRLQHLEQAIAAIEHQVGNVVKKSSVYETAAWGFTAQPAFLNQVLCVNSELRPDELLRTLLGIEQQLGRKRFEKMGPRTIDLDILFYGNQIISTKDLIVPHPRIAERRFVLTPLNEIAAGFVHPVFKKTIRELLDECHDTLEVTLYQSR